MAPLLHTHKKAPGLLRHAGSGGSGQYAGAWNGGGVVRRFLRLFSLRRMPMSRLFAYSLLAMVAVRFVLLSMLAPKATTLVVYIAGYSDAEAINNVEFFMKHGVRENDGAHYIIAIEQDYYLDTIDLFPSSLPPNVEIVQTEVRCYNWGTLGWVLKNKVDWRRYKHFVWADSSARGPFLPNYVGATGKAWHQLLTGMINEETKLVGGSISCSGIKLNPAHPTIPVPHVQGYLGATDRKGLEVMMATEGPSAVFACHQNFVPGVRFSEMGASEVILNAGYNIGSLMLRYRGVDFRDKHLWNCNDRMNPLFEHMYDGYTVSPLETMFVKMRHHDVINAHPAAVAARKYESWTQQKPLEINQNAFKAMAELHLEHVKAKGQQCFDAELYIGAAPVEFANFTLDQAWEHFIMWGFREGRAHRFYC